MRHQIPLISIVGSLKSTSHYWLVFLFIYLDWARRLPFDHHHANVMGGQASLQFCAACSILHIESHFALLAQKGTDVDDIPAIRRYDIGDRLYVQAQRIWLILVAFVKSPTRKSSDPKTITYGEVAELMGYPDKRAGHMLGRQLGIVGQYCKLNDLPALNSIVVNQMTGVPGEDVLLRDGRTVKEEQRAVMAEDWFALRMPTTGTLRKVWDLMN